MRRRLGVVLLLPEPWSSEVKGLRRALGAPSLDTQPPHLTLVPPVNVSDARVNEAVGVLRRAAANCVPVMSLTLGPPASFAPVSPVVYLEVGGDLEALVRLQADVFGAPLHRIVDYDYIPHVTLHESASDETIRVSATLLRGYQIDVSFDRVCLLEQGPDRVWSPLTDISFGSPVVRGRGGVELHFRWTSRPAPDVRTLIEHDASWWVSDERSDCLHDELHLEARDAQDRLVGTRLGESVVVASEWLGYGIEERLLAEPQPH